MGTTADKLQAILNSKNAIRDKFGIPDSVPFSQYADLIRGEQEIILGYVNNSRQFQPLSFNISEPTDLGAPETISEYCTWKRPGEKEIVTLSWDALSEKVQAGQFTKANLGNLIRVNYNAPTDIGTIVVPLFFEIVAIDNANLVDESISHSITLFSVKCLGSRVMGSYRWKSASARTFLSTVFFEGLDPEFSSHIATVNRPHWYKGIDVDIVADTVFLPSYTEIGLGDNNNYFEGRQWDIMTSQEARIRDCEGNYWLSSRNPTVSNTLHVIDSTGNATYQKHNVAGCICPALVFV